MAPPITRPTVACLSCGSLFRQRNEGHRYCSIPCRDAAHDYVQIPISCETCGEVFSVRTRWLAHGPRRRRFCSPECRHIGHRVLATPENIAAKFWANVDVQGPAECWPWKLAPGKAGYGIVTLYKFKQTAHRVSYELHNGPIPDLGGAHGGCVLHKCDNRICVNPEHLFLGTQKANLQDMYAKGRNRGKGQRSAA